MVSRATHALSSLPDEMSVEVRARLRYDFAVFGTCFYEETEEGYRHLDPVETIRHSNMEGDDGGE